MRIQNNINIQPIQINSNNNRIKQQSPNRQNPNFTGWYDVALNYLDTSPAWGAVAVDLLCMVLPRTLTDWIKRGTEAGVETGRREGMGTFNHSMIGVYAVAAGLLLATGISKTFGLKAKDIGNMFIDSETMDLHGQIWDKQLKSGTANPLKEYLKETFKNYEALSPKRNGGWVKFKDQDIDEVVNILEEEIKANNPKMSKEAFASIKNKLIGSAGVENNFRIISDSTPHTSRYSIGSLIDNSYKLGKAFSQEKVKNAFREAVNAADNTFLKAMKNLNLRRSVIGLAMATAVGLSAQPLNMYLTRKKTGTTGFVGGGEEDKSAAFKVKKSIASLLFGGFALSTIGNPVKLISHPQELLKQLQFKGYTPTIKQFKFVYGLTIMSRLLSSRNDNELKESLIKDFLGFASWLILGNFVQKLVAQAADPSLIKLNDKTKGSKVLNWIQNSVLKTREEVLHEALGKDVFKDGKPLKLNEMLKAVSNNKAVKKQLRILTGAQFAGYLYSALALGIGIPRLNIYLTKRRMAKEEAQKQANPHQSFTSQNASQPTANMYKPENMKFLSQFCGKSLLS